MCDRSSCPPAGVLVMAAVRRLRVLIIEDDRGRVRTFKSWLPEDVIPVVAWSAGRALGILERDRGNVYAGILLDHDLQQLAATGADEYLSGTQVVEAIVRNVSTEVPILVHSMNPARAPVMARRLAEAGFSVTQVPMEALDRERLGEWLQDVRAFWADA
jgi:CheY-like chemotaxis protein